MPLDAPQPLVVVVAGPSGTGKSTVGTLLAARLSVLSPAAPAAVPFIEGDDLHPPAVSPPSSAFSLYLTDTGGFAQNVEKMSGGVPLTDDDRWPWLARVAQTAATAATQHAPGTAVAACSALNPSYRAYLSQHLPLDAGTRPSLLYVFLYPAADGDLLVRRVDARAAATGHFMGAAMVASQLATMSVPAADEGGAAYACLSVPVRDGVAPDTIVQTVVQHLQTLGHI